MYAQVDNISRRTACAQAPSTAGTLCFSFKLLQLMAADEQMGKLRGDISAACASAPSITESNDDISFIGCLQLKAADEQIGKLRGDISAAEARIGPAQQSRDNLLVQRDAIRQTQLASEGAKQQELK
jgi:hypothetical protein